jgi:thymidylate synthase (FAD)
MGEVASTCWNSTPSSQIGIDCIESNHGRILEYADVTLEISDYSARVIRELYTHIIGTSRVQQSTRYVNCSDFNYYIPEAFYKNDKVLTKYKLLMKDITKSYDWFISMGIKKEDVANILPLGMHTKIVLKINARALLHMSENRECTRAYKEYRDLMKEIKETLSGINNEWKTIVSYMKPVCEVLGYCREKRSCGKYSSRKEVINEDIFGGKNDQSNI